MESDANTHRYQPVAILAILFVVACGKQSPAVLGPTSPTPTAQSPTEPTPHSAMGSEVDGPAVAPDASSDAWQPRFSSSASSPDVSIFALNFAQAIALDAHPSGDVVLLACSEAQTDFSQPTKARGPRLVLALVNPRGGNVRWVRQLNLDDAAFENNCGAHHSLTYPGPRLYSSQRLAVDGAGRIFVSAFVQRTAGELLDAENEISRGAVVLAFSENGDLRWSHQVVGDLAAVVGIAASEDGGVDALVRSYAKDGLDTHSLIHLNADGDATTLALLTSAPMDSRTRCSLRGCHVSVDWFERLRDGSILLYGYRAGVALTLGSSTLKSQPSGLHRSPFWARLGPDGQLRWMRGTPRILKNIVLADDDQVMATMVAGSQDKTVMLKPSTGTLSRWSAKRAFDGPLAVAISRFAAQQRLLASATLTGPGPARAMLPAPIKASITPRQLNHLSTIVPGAQASTFTELQDGSLVQFTTLHPHEHLELNGLAAAPAKRTVDCHPGNVGEEGPSPPGGCQLDRPSAVLLFWPAAP